MTLLRNSGSRLAKLVGVAMLATLGLCVLAPAHAQAQTVEWSQRPVSGPSPRDAHAMVYDAARGVTVLFGGGTSSGASGETWEWNGTAWTQPVVSGPSARYLHAMTYDAARGVTVLFGGTNVSGTTNGETWEWNGTAWTQQAVSGPSPRCWHAMAYDAARGVTVLFGGRVGTNSRNGETWEWNGTAWTQRVVTGPSPRYKHAMAYDAARGVTVLFGGAPNSGYSAETWEWNGTAWTQRVVSGPSPRNDHAMAYNAARGVTVLFGGGTSNGGTNDETWEWNGTAWTQRMVAGPSPRWSHRMAFDAGRGVTVLFGGYTVSPYYNGETWELEPPCAPISFTSHPSSVALVPGSTASFSVSVNGPATSLHWRHNSVELADGARISGSTIASLMISSVQASDEGAYDCVVSSACNTVTSDPAILSCDPILLSQPPESALLVPGLQLAVTVPSNAPYSYRWRQNEQNLFNIPGFYSGVTTRTLTILTMDPSLEGRYDLVVTDACGTVTTAATTVSICDRLDYNGDGLFPDTADIDDFLSVFSGGTCSTGACADIDFNNDSLYPDTTDIDAMLSVFSGGPCI